MSILHAMPHLVPGARKGSARAIAGVPAWTPEGIAWFIAGAIAAAYLMTFVLLSPLPLQDFPTHLARAVVMNDLIFQGGSRFGDVYSYHYLFMPYVLGDLLLVGAVKLFGPTGASALWIAVTFLSLPVATLFYLRCTGLLERRRPLMLLLSMYLGTDWFFSMGFLSFRLGIAILLVTLALVEALRRRWSATLHAIYASAVLLGYLMHLSTVLWLAAALGVTGLMRTWWREVDWRTETRVAAPVAAVLLWHFGVADRIRSPGDLVENPYTVGTLYEKFSHLGCDFFRYDRPIDALLIAVLAACLVLQMGWRKVGQLRAKRLCETLALALTFVALYCALPAAYADASYVDVRALPLATLFLIMACLIAAEAGPAIGELRMALALLLATVLAAGNLAALTTVLYRNHSVLVNYRKIITAIPEHGRVFPVYTLHSVGAVMPLLHANSFITIDRSGVMPYEFSGDNGNPEKYFRYLKRPYDPAEDWYFKARISNIDWESVACSYQYLLVTQPYTAERLLLSTTVVASNDAASLLAIDGKACHRRRI